MRKLWVLILLLPILALGQDFAKVGTVGAQFLKISIGARGAGMGGAFEGVANDVSSMFYNPSGLVYVQGTSVFVSHTAWMADMGFEALGIAKNIPDFGVVGIGMGYLGSGDIERTTVENPDGGIGNFSTEHWFASVSVARRLTDKFSVGGNVKFIRERLDDESSNAWATDLGVHYMTGFKSLRLAMSVRNFGPEIQLSGTYYDLDNGQPLSTSSEYLPYHFPLTFKIGMAMELYEDTDYRVTGAVDVEHPNDNLERLRGGVEGVIWQKLALRTGYAYNHDSESLAFGAGFLWNNMTVDYSYTDYGVLDWVHRFDFIFNL